MMAIPLEKAWKMRKLSRRWNRDGKRGGDGYLNGKKENQASNSGYDDGDDDW